MLKSDTTYVFGRRFLSRGKQETSGSNLRINNIDQALRVLKKKMQREGVLREMKERRAYEKPSEKRNRLKAHAIRRGRKAARKLAQREGLLPARKRKRGGQVTVAKRRLIPWDIRTRASRQ